MKILVFYTLNKADVIAVLRLIKKMAIFRKKHWVDSLAQTIKFDSCLVKLLTSRQLRVEVI